MREHLTAKNGWRALGLGIALFEIACPRGETLSEGVDGLMERHPASKLAVAALGAITVAHLVNVIPEQADPFHYMLFWKDRDGAPGA